MIFRTIFIQLIGLCLIALFIIRGIPLLTPLVDQAIQNQTKQVFNEHGLTWVNIAFHERDISLGGSTLDQAAHHQAISLAKSLWYVRNIHDNITPKPIKPYTMQLYADRQKLTIDTYVESQENKSKIKEIIHEINKNRELKEDIKVAFGQPEHWLALQTLLFKYIDRLELLSVSVIENDLSISAAANQQKVLDQLKSEFRNIKNMGFNITQYDFFAYDYAKFTCQNKFKSLTAKENIQFESGKSVIEKSSYDLLAEIKKNALLCINSKINIVGHTDNRGDDDENRQLSYNRALAVKAWLFTHGGIPLARLEAIGKGSSEPIENNNTKAGRAKNRRIEFIVEDIE
ncbi:MAG: OmpA family protein [bacterium]